MVNKYCLFYQPYRTQERETIKLNEANDDYTISWNTASGSANYCGTKTKESFIIILEELQRERKTEKEREREQNGGTARLINS